MPSVCWNRLRVILIVSTLYLHYCTIGSHATVCLVYTYIHFTHTDKNLLWYKPIFFPSYLLTYWQALTMYCICIYSSDLCALLWKWSCWTNIPNKFYFFVRIDFDLVYSMCVCVLRFLQWICTSATLSASNRKRDNTTSYLLGALTKKNHCMAANIFYAIRMMHL